MKSESEAWSNGPRRRAGVGLLAPLLLLGWLAGNVEAQFYKWVDKNGGVHFTDNYQELPPEFRARYRYKGKLRQRRRPSKAEAPAVEPSSAKPQAAGPQPAKPQAAGPKSSPSSKSTAGEQASKVKLTPQQAVERLLTKKFISGFEQRDVPALLALMTKDFSFQADAGAILSRRGYGSRLERFFDKLMVKSVEVRSVRVQRGAKTLSASFRFLLSYELQGGERRLRKALYTVGFRQVGETWLMNRLSEKGLQDYRQEG